MKISAVCTGLTTYYRNTSSGLFENSNCLYFNSLVEDFYRGVWTIRMYHLKNFSHVKIRFPRNNWFWLSSIKIYEYIRYFIIKKLIILNIHNIKTSQKKSNTNGSEHSQLERYKTVRLTYNSNICRSKTN